MAKRRKEYADQDSLKRLELEADPITVATDGYTTVQIPKDTLLTLTPVLDKGILDRYPERVIFIRNTHGTKSLKYQIEYSIDESPDDAIANNWFVSDSNIDKILIAGGTVMETSSKVPYTGMRVRLKRATAGGGEDSSAVVIVSFSKWR